MPQGSRKPLTAATVRGLPRATLPSSSHRPATGPIFATIVCTTKIWAATLQWSAKRPSVSAIASATAVGIGVAEHSATQVSAKRVTPSKAEFRLSDHQRLRKMLLGQEHIVPQR